MGTDGKKMSKSLGNDIAILSSPDEKFGKIMSISDNLLINFFTYATNYTEKQIRNIEKRLTTENPRDIKLLLAREIVTIYHSSNEAEKSEKDFLNVFSNKNKPENIPVFKLQETQCRITKVLKKSGVTESINEGRRLIIQGGLSINGVRISNPDYLVDINEEQSILIKAGKRRFLRLEKQESGFRTDDAN